MSTSFLDPTENPALSPEDINFISAKALKADNGIALLKLVNSSTNETVNAYRKNSFSQPIRHLKNQVSYEVLKGSCDVIFFSDDGIVKSKNKLSSNTDDLDKTITIKTNKWYSIIAKSPLTVIKSTQTNAATDENTESPSWEPDLKDYIQNSDEKSEAVFPENSDFDSLVIGCDSLIGLEIMKYLRMTNINHAGTSRQPETIEGNRIYLDLSNDPKSWKLPENVKTVYICAAMTSILECDNEPSKSHQVNVDRTLHLAEHYHKRGAKVVYLSSNAVFDGEKIYSVNDPTSAKVEYGTQQAKLEEAFQERGIPVIIVRLSKVFSIYTPLIQSWISDLINQQTIQPLSDYCVSPLSAPFVAETLCKLAKIGKPGIYHLSGAKDISYSDAASILARLIESDESLVKPITIEEKGINLKHRFAYSTLDISPLDKMLGISRPTTEESFKNLLKL